MTKIYHQASWTTYFILGTLCSLWISRWLVHSHEPEENWHELGWIFSIQHNISLSLQSCLRFLSCLPVHSNVLYFLFNAVGFVCVCVCVYMVCVHTYMWRSAVVVSHELLPLFVEKGSLTGSWKTALSQDPHSQHVHQMAHNHLKLQLQGNPILLTSALYLPVSLSHTHTKN